MKTVAKKSVRGAEPSKRASAILSALKAARRTAVHNAKLHKVPVVYLRDDTLVRERS